MYVVVVNKEISVKAEGTDPEMKWRLWFGCEIACVTAQRYMKYAKNKKPSRKRCDIIGKAIKM